MTVHGNPIELSVLLVLHWIEMSARAAMADISECDKGFFQLISDRYERATRACADVREPQSAPRYAVA